MILLLKYWRELLILILGIIIVFFIFSNRKQAIDDYKLDALENEKKEISDRLWTLIAKTKRDQDNWMQHLKHDSINSLNAERLERSLTKARADYKEAVERNKAVFSYDQAKLDSAFRQLYPNEDPNR